MPGALWPVVTLFLTGFLVGIKIAAAQSATGAPTTITTEAPPPGPETCPEFIDYNKTVELPIENFINQLEDCVQISKDARNKLKNNALFPVLLYENLKNNSLSGLSSLFTTHSAMLKNITQCVKQKSGKDFTKEEATRHFGFNGTQYLAFDFGHCSKSMKTRDCVERVYLENVKDPETKIHKDAFTSSFEIVATYCELPLRFLARGAGYNVLPSLYLVIGTALMMTKLAIFN